MAKSALKFALKNKKKGSLFFLCARERREDPPFERGRERKLFCIFFTRICKNIRFRTKTTLSSIGQKDRLFVVCSVCVRVHKYKRAGAEEAEREREWERYGRILLYNKLIKGFFCLPLRFVSFHRTKKRRTTLRRRKEWVPSRSS